jgi:hypothetical protein
MPITPRGGGGAGGCDVMDGSGARKRSYCGEGGGNIYIPRRGAKGVIDM